MSTATKLSPTIEDVEKLFKTWRKTRKNHKPMPAELWEAAINLIGKYSISAISKRLVLNPTELKRRAPTSCTHPPDKQRSAPAFIELEIAAHGVDYGCTIEMEDKMGSKMKIHAKDTRSLDLYELCRTFWSNRP